MTAILLKAPAQVNVRTRHIMDQSRRFGYLLNRLLQLSVTRYVEALDIEANLSQSDRSCSLRDIVISYTILYYQ